MYIQDTLTHEIRNFLVLAAKWTNRWFNKPKFHILVHLPDHIRRFGPAMLFATEAFESFNAIIRAKSVHSNRHAPSRDIGNAFAQGNRVRHLLSGGLFLLKDSYMPQDLTPTLEANSMVPTILSWPFSCRRQDWTSIGEGVSTLVASSSTVTGYLGLHDSRIQDRQRGTCIRSNRPSCVWSATQTGRLHAQPASKTVDKFYTADSMYLNNGDRCWIEDFVIVRDPRRVGQTRVGWVAEILQCVNLLEPAGARIHRLRADCPVVHR